MSRSVFGNTAVFFAPPGSAGIPAGYWMVNSVPVPITAFGNDSTGDGSQAKPFATPQKAVDYLYQEIDLNNKFTATVYAGVAPTGAQFYYPGVQISGRIVGQAGSLPPLEVGTGCPAEAIGKYKPFSILGDPANPLGAFLNPNRVAGRAAIPALSLTDGAGVRISGIALDTSTASMDCIDVFLGSFLDISDLWFGNAGTPGGADANAHIAVAWGGRLMISGNYDVSGGGAQHIAQGADSVIYPNTNGGQSPKVKATFHGNTSFSQGVVSVERGIFYAMGMEFALAPGASVTGTRYVVSDNGIIYTNTSPLDQNYIPGSTPGVVLDGIYK